jgi:hypothetical protein
MKLHRRFPNVLLPAALVLLAILANPAAASGRRPVGDTLLPSALRDSFPNAVSYAAVPIAARVTSAESALLRSRVGGWDYAEWLRSEGIIKIYDGGSAPPDNRLKDGEQVLRAGTVPELEALVPGAVLFNRDRRAPGGHFIAYRDSVFAVKGLNRLFHYAGVSFDSSTMVARARLALLLVTAVEEKPVEVSRATRTRDGLIPSGYGVGSLAVPQVSFLLFKAEYPVKGAPGIAQVDFECLSGQSRRHETVHFWRYGEAGAQLRLIGALAFDEVPLPPSK